MAVTFVLRKRTCKQYFDYAEKTFIGSDIKGIAKKWRLAIWAEKNLGKSIFFSDKAN